jgi:hypothetical protein
MAPGRLAQVDQTDRQRELIETTHAVTMDGWLERSGTDRCRWELVVARLADELDKLNDHTLDSDSKSQAVRTVYEIFGSIMARALELEAFAELWTKHHPVLQERLDDIRFAYPLPVPSWDGNRSNTADDA